MEDKSKSVVIYRNERKKQRVGHLQAWKIKIMKCSERYLKAKLEIKLNNFFFLFRIKLCVIIKFKEKTADTRTQISSAPVLPWIAQCRGTVLKLF